jgi:hypothetical protein
MSSPTGFRAYHIYNVVKYVHFGSKKYDISKSPLCKRDVFLKKWNDEVRHKGISLLYLKLDKLFNNKELIRLFSYYYLEDKDFYVTAVIEDDLRIFKKYETELELLKEVIESDLLRIFILMKKNNKLLKDILFSKNGMPLILQMYDRKIINVHTLLAFDIVWSIGSKIKVEHLNIVEAEKYKKYRLIFDKYKQIVYKYFNFDMKTFIEKLYRDNFK